MTNPYTAGTVGELKDVLTAIKNDVGTGTYYDCTLKNFSTSLWC
ncbi:hypothetical protein [Enterococcus thailandicus]|nr:hypothetical protein [Enterococcus thailandicus]